MTASFKIETNNDAEGGEGALPLPTNKYIN